MFYGPHLCYESRQFQEVTHNNLYRLNNLFDPTLLWLILFPLDLVTALRERSGGKQAPQQIAEGGSGRFRH